MALLENVGINVIFENNEVILSKNDILTGNGLCNHGFYVLNIVNDSISVSAYIVESIFFMAC